jgi:hypothetical protein
MQVDGAGDEPSPEDGDGWGVEGEQVPEVEEAEGFGAERAWGGRCGCGLVELVLHVLPPF